ncbi:MAG: hypothetical protein IKF64_04010, partial [Eubacterium sp.]|nr:hypothetical protein [Eubacterium sp.]
EEYKLKADLCEKALHTERVSLSDTITIIESVSEFIKKDEQTESFNNDRITVYADTIRIMTDALEAITMYYYKRLSSASLNASVYASVLINLAEKIAEFSYSLIEYNQNSEIVEVVLSLCGSAQSNLASCLPVYIPNLSKETYERIPIVAAKVEEVGKRFKDSYTVREDLLDISKSNSDNTGNNSNGCYVATAVYGSYDCPQVWTLRRYRDNQLAKTWYGRAFIYTYYAISPTIVKLFGNTAWFKKMWRGKLDRMVQNLNSNGVENTPYNDIEW